MGDLGTMGSPDISQSQYKEWSIFFYFGQRKGEKEQESVSNYLAYFHGAFARTEPLNY